MYTRPYLAFLGSAHFEMYLKVLKISPLPSAAYQQVLAAQAMEPHWMASIIIFGATSPVSLERERSFIRHNRN